MMKRAGVILGTLVLAVVLAVPVLAQGRWGKGGYGGYWGRGPCWQYDPGPPNLTQEQNAQMEQLSRRFYEETSPLQNDLYAKRSELSTLLIEPDPDRDKVNALQSQINDLRAKLSEKRLEHQLEMRKINPDLRFGQGYYGRGYGPRTRGWGPGMGYGPRGGFGPGPGYCWNY